MKIPILIYALLLFVGGVMGYFMKGSVPSLVMGSVSGVIFAVLAFSERKGAYQATTGLTVALSVFFGLRFYETHKIFPGGVMAVVSLLLLMWLIRARLSSACCKIDASKPLK